MTIRLLTPQVASRIAAGEVIERPASVVKELVENSLDAGATEVSVDAVAGGTESLRVADNGVGIAADEAELAFQRFATSKLTESAELETVSTLGFRGEALPSIAAVSSVSLVTRTGPDVSGTRVDSDDGRIVRTRQAGTAPGTAVTVRHLFRSFPARRKFLRSASTEASRIQTLVARYALAYPHITFRLTLSGSTALATTGSGDLREAVGDIYGAKIGNAMLELAPDPETDGEGTVAVGGMIGPASISRASRSHISLFVNGRWVQDRMLGYALEQAYHGFMPERRYPVAVVSLTIPHEDVDVNVHPSKTEVRLRDSGKAFSALQQAVRHTLNALSPVPELGRPPTPTAPPSARPRGTPLWPSAPAPPTTAHPRPGHAPIDETAPSRVEQPGAPLDPEPLAPRQALPALRVLGQVQSTYITAEGPDGVYLIDQHAAHERVLFEQVMARWSGQPPEVQSLLEPATVELDPRQAEVAETHAELIGDLGFLFEPFGGRTFIVRAVPGLLAEGDPGRSFVDILDLMAEGGGFRSWEERAAYSLACHGAIRAGKVLSQGEMSELARLLEACDQPHTCPHGRPTMVHLSSATLEREFGRR